MAFFNRTSNHVLLRHTNPSIFQMMRCLSNWKLFVGGLAPTVNDTSLREAFSVKSVNGEVLEAKVVVDRKTGKSRGFGFVSFEDHDDAWNSIDTMDQGELHRHTMTVRWAKNSRRFIVDSVPDGMHDPNNDIDIPEIRYNIFQTFKYTCNDSWMDSEASCEILGSGMILLKNYITHRGQVALINLCQKWGVGPGGFYEPCNRGGQMLRHHMMCLGRNWDPANGYANKHSIDGSEPPPLSNGLDYLVESAIKYAQAHLDELPSMCPDTCVINYFSWCGRLGIHQDCDESSDSLERGLPVVLIVVGESAEFWYGHTRDENKFCKIVLRSGDVLIYGGESRLIFHGVKKILPDGDTSSLYRETPLRAGCLTLTFKQY